jgi:hypothetical protein
MFATIFSMHANSGGLLLTGFLFLFLAAAALGASATAKAKD